MKKILSIASLLVVVILFAACSNPTKTSSTPTRTLSRPLWMVTDASIQNPESTYYDAESKFIFVSNVAGEAAKKDGNGWISKLDPATGKVIAGKWVEGLNAPKGIRISKGILWVSDITDLVAIDIAAAKIKKRYPIKGAKFLNDIAIGPKGEVYVSDMMTGKIHVARNGKVSVFAKDPSGELPNGLIVTQDALIVAGWGAGMKPDFSTKTNGHLTAFNLKTKKKSLITPNELGHLDGLELDHNGNYFVSDWLAGKVFFVNAKGEATLLLQDKMGTADIGYLPESHQLIVPQMVESKITAYQL